MKHYKSFEVLSIFQYQSPQHERKTPLVKTSWRRFWIKQSVTVHENSRKAEVSLRVHYCKRNEDNVTTLLWQNSRQQNDLTSRKLFSELYKIMVNKVTFIGFRGENRPSRPAPDRS